MRSIHRPLFLLATAALTLGSAGVTSASAASTSVKLKSFSISLGKKSFSKGTVTFNVSNSSGTSHNFCVKGSGINKCTPTFSSGSKKLKVSFSKKGTYTGFCSVGSHREAGMEEKIKIT